MKREVLIVPSIPDITDGHIGDTLRARGAITRVFNYKKDHDLTAQQFDGLVVLGAPYGVDPEEPKYAEFKDQIKRTRQLVGQAINGEWQVPTLGICHGEQVIGAEVGAATVPASPHSQHGTRSPDGRLYTMKLTDVGRQSRFFKDVTAEDIPTFHSNDYMIDMDSDRSGRLKLAGIGNIVVPQAVLVDDTDVILGLQFHNEPTDDKFGDWQKNAKGLKPLDHRAMDVDLAKTRTERVGFIVQVSNNFMDIIEFEAAARQA